MKNGKERIIYDNYNLWDDYNEFAKETLASNGIENPSENDIWEEINFQDSIYWEDCKETLRDFFDGDSKWLLQGHVELWHGTYGGGFVFTSFDQMWHKTTVDCEFFKLYDVNGHFYLKCSHHDGTNLYEIRKLTEKGIAYYERWEDSHYDKRSEKDVHNMLNKRYSTLPHFASKIYGCPRVEYAEKK